MRKRLLSHRVARKLGIKIAPKQLAKVYPRYDIGRGSYGDLDVLDFGDGATFSMGAYCSVAANCKVMLGAGIAPVGRRPIRFPFWNHRWSIYPATRSPAGMSGLAAMSGWQAT